MERRSFLTRLVAALTFPLTLLGRKTCSSSSSKRACSEPRCGVKPEPLKIDLTYWSRAQQEEENPTPHVGPVPVVRDSGPVDIDRLDYSKLTMEELHVLVARYKE